ncbi:pentapeptide repeat-containing protein [Maribacter sp. SA7]|uniref:pentapeptide repeat-containing protein n=1 Tax=Maribacter zhoushanensis TaxID=3030012 RepID=UPI0023ECE4FD|nr:pentapeptide repeat-containing protein [Maribacter zhoushanensis]MDF4203969.1 pentapeptide repeat-containing protein [Maribacter zhoushanensis]
MDLIQLNQILKGRGSNTKNIENKEFDVSDTLIDGDSISPTVNTITFKNCIFSGLEFLVYGINKPNLKIKFIDCSLNCRTIFEKCTLYSLYFIDTEIIDRCFEIKFCNLKRLDLISRYKLNKKHLSGSFHIENNTILEHVSFENLVHKDGVFEFTENSIGDKSLKSTPISKSEISFKNAELNNCDLSDSNFGDVSIFDNANFRGERSFLSNNSEFNKAFFNNVDFGKTLLFNGSTFKDIVIFNKCSNLSKTVGDFSGCTFRKNLFFDYSEFNDLTFKNVSFERNVSFANCILNKITLNQILFEKVAFFDNIEIIDLKLCSKETLRTIKQELQKSDNRIDYNKFKVYELEAHRAALSKKDWSDKFILWLNSISSNHGTNWIKSIKFTLITALLFYIIYFTFENSNKEFEINYQSINYFVTGFFKYLIPTYQSPFEKGLSNGLFYIPFLIGKIAIGYGLFQTIVSFRKFRI